MEHWGLSTSIDVRGCNPELIRSAAHIQDYVIQLCKLIDMKRYGDCVVVHFGTDNKEGYSMYQLIETSNISGHFANDLNAAFIDIFSCKEYDPDGVRVFTQEFFEGEQSASTSVYRG